MQIEALFWFIGFIFFQPLHLGLPILYIMIYREESQRSSLIKTVSIAGVVSSAIIFFIAFLLASSYLYVALGLVVLSIPLPWIKLMRLTTSDK
jgi:uncharacterized membrane protein